jgi:FXSXX-COOH protein
MDRFVTDIPSEMIDLSGVSLEQLPVLDDPVLQKSLARLLVEVADPISSNSVES